MEGSRVSFWHDPWCGPTPLKELFSSMYACSVSKEAWISDLVVSNLEGGRSWNLLFRHGQPLSTHSLSLFIPLCRGVRGMISWSGD